MMFMKSRKGTTAFQLRPPDIWSSLDQQRTTIMANKFASKNNCAVINSASAISNSHFEVGKMTNTENRFWEFPSLITGPLGLILSIVLIWNIIGWPCLLGVATILIAQGVNVLCTRALLRVERDRRKATDDKLQQISQYIGAIRHLRWYAWERIFATRVLQARQLELNLRVVTGLLRILISFVNTFASGMFPVAAFYAFTALAGRPLRIEIAFPALQLFTMLENSLRDVPRLITVLLNANIAVSRMTVFMNEPNQVLATPQSSDEREQDCSSVAETRNGVELPKSELMLQKACFSWPGTSEALLNDVSVTFSTGLTVICGKVGVGKTTLLQALLGELDLSSGRVKRSGKPVGYCAQIPWLQSMSIRENILFFQSFDRSRYEQVLEACALTPDLASFKGGDLSEIGENGIGLSGGM